MIYNGRLAHSITIDIHDRQPSRKQYLVDAETGELLQSTELIKAAEPGTAGSHVPMFGERLMREDGSTVTFNGWKDENGPCFMYHRTEKWGIFDKQINAWVQGPSANWGSGNRAAVSLAKNFSIIQDYASAVLGMNSYDNLGSFAKVNVHAGWTSNASWDGTEFNFGDGDPNGLACGPTGVLDIAAHEFAHAVIDNSSQLVYAGEPGALSESIADIFATAVEFHSQPSGSDLYPGSDSGHGDWLFGEDARIDDVAFRDLRNPSRYHQPSYYHGDQWYAGAVASTFVHTNSGVQNFAFYLLAEGGTGTNNGVPYTVSGMGIDRAAEVVLYANRYLLTSYAQFRDARNAWILAAQTLGYDVDAVSDAWDAVGVIGGERLLSITPTTVGFGNVGVGATEPIDLTFSNSGDDAVVVSAATRSDPAFACGIQIPFLVAPGSSRTVPLTCTPDRLGSLSGTITFSSNAEDAPSIVVGATANGVAPAVISVTPASFHVALDAIASTTQDLHINNLGVADLRFTLVSPATWLTVSPASGTLGSGSNASVGLSLNAVSLVGGLYTANLQLTHNDPGRSSPIAIPCSLIVTGSKALTVLEPAGPAYSLAFGDVWVGSTLVKTIRLQAGNDTVRISNIAISNARFTVPTATMSIPPNAIRAIEVTFSPTDGSLQSGDLRIVNNTGATPEIVVDLSGTGKTGPRMVLSAPSFSRTLDPGQQSETTLQIQNAGQEDLRVSCQVYPQGPRTAIATNMRLLYLQTYLPDGATEDFVDSIGKLPSVASITVKSGESFTPSLSYLLQYDAVIVASLNPWQDPAATGNALADFADRNGLVILFNMALLDDPYIFGLVGTRISTPAYAPMAATTGLVSLDDDVIDGPDLTLSAIADHPITKGLAQIGSEICIEGRSINAGCTALGTWSSSDYWGACNNTKPVVAFNLFPMNTFWSGQLPQLIENTLNWFASKSWLRASPEETELIIPPSSAQDISITFDAAGLPAGFKSGMIQITHNDPNLPSSVSVPCSLTVTGTPALSLSLSAIDFGTIFSGTDSTRALHLSNPGSDTTTITWSDPGAAFMVQGTSPFKIRPSGVDSLLIRFSPTEANTFSASLQLQTNVSGSENISVPLQGIAVVGPHLTADPLAVTATTAAGGTGSSALTIGNTGQSPLEYSLHILDRLSGDPGSLELDGKTALGGPDASGYRWIDSDEPGGPAYAWRDIKATGSRLALVSSSDEGIQSVSLGFTFSFYGSPHSTMYVYSNGYVALMPGGSFSSNAVLPSSIMPAELIAAFHRDLNPSLRGGVYFQTDGHSATVQYDSVSFSGGVGTYSFQIILDESGTILFQYKTLRGPLTPATVGIQDSSRTKGLTVCYNAPYLHEGLAVRIAPKPSWISAAQWSGTVDPASSVTIPVTMSAADLVAGVYAGALAVQHNDPLQPSPVVVPCTLTVTGTPQIAVSPSSLGFGTLYLGDDSTATVTVRNPGSGPTTISSSSIDEAAFSLQGLSPGLVIGPGDSVLAQVRYAPSAVGTSAATLTIGSDAGEVTVSLAGACDLGPSVAVRPALLRGTAQARDSLTDTLRIRNDGSAPLSYRIGVTDAGGVDTGNYACASSDDPAGPVFVWNDIRGLAGAARLTQVSENDERSESAPLSFGFRLYDSTYRTIQICSNGYVKLGPAATQKNNLALPSAGAPASIIAGFWDDLNPAQSGDVYFKDFGDRVVVQYQDVAIFGGEATYTFQIVLRTDGDVYFYYNDINGPVTGATAGIQDSSRTKGITVAHNVSFVRSGLAVRLSRRIPWLSVIPAGGSVPAGDSVALPVRMSAAAFTGGVQTGLLSVFHNDPLSASPVQVPCTLTVVGVKSLSASPASLEFGAVWTHAKSGLRIALSNSGTDTTTVTSVTSDNPVLAVDTTLPVKVAPGGSVQLPVAFRPLSVREENGTLTVTSNAGDNPSLAVPVHGTGTQGPVLSLSPLRPKIIAETGGVGTSVLTVANPGGATLAFDVTNALPAWLTLSTTSGSVPAGGSLDVSATGDATSLAVGPYAVVLAVEHNDPATLSPAMVPCTLFVVSATVPVVAFSAPSQIVTEGGTVTVRAVLSAHAGSDVSVPFTVGGTAPAADHDLVAGTVLIPKGQLSGEVTFRTVDNSYDEENVRTVVLTMGEPVNATAGTPATHTVMITDNDPLPSIAFTAAAQSVAETVGTAAIMVRLSSASARQVGVSIAVTGTAGIGDRGAIPAGIVFLPGETEKVVAFTVIDDQIDETDEMVVLTLTGPGNAVVGSPGVHTVTIADNEDLLTVEATPGGITGPAGDTSVTQGDTAGIRAVASAGWFFDRWTPTAGSAVILDPLSARTGVVLTSGNAAIKAVFVKGGTILVSGVDDSTGVFLYGSNGWQGRLARTGGGAIPDLAPGAYEVVLTRAGMRTEHVHVAVTSDATAAVAESLHASIPMVFDGIDTLTAGASPIATGDYAATVLEDLDGDGDDDLLALGSDGRFSFFVREGDTYVASGMISDSLGGELVVPSATALRAVDMNADGRLDLIVGLQDGSVIVYANRSRAGGLVFGAPVTLMSLGSGLTGLDIADLNGDGMPDLVAGFSSGVVVRRTSLSTNWSSLSWSAAETLKVGTAPIDVGGDAVPMMVDLTGDGKPDLLCANAPGEVQVFTDAGTGAFSARGMAVAGGRALVLDGCGSLAMVAGAPGDLPTVLLTDRRGTAIIAPMVLQGDMPSPLTGLRDGKVNLLDFSLFVRAWRSSEGDLNWNRFANFDATPGSKGMQTINLADYNLFVQGWGKTK